MKKILVASICLIVMLTASACHVQIGYNYLHAEASISEISVVQLSFVENDLVQTEVCVIENVAVFVDKLNGLPCFLWKGDPIPATPNGAVATVFRISYKNGSYELINWNGQSKYTAEYGMKYYAGYRRFDQAAFAALLEDYLS